MIICALLHVRPAQHGTTHRAERRPQAPKLPAAVQVCYAIGQLASGFRDAGSSSTPLSPFFQEITTALLATVRPHHRCIR